jgi:GNAT superfamily N-acetyltransferase
MIVNMLVDLTAAIFTTEDETAVTVAANVVLEHRRGVADADVAWIRSSFGGSWPDEAAAGWNWLARRADGTLAGFCTYEQREYRWWWLEAWLAQADVGIFGPMGIDPASRGKRIGCVLARRALASMKARGLERAVIPAVGPVAFYERCCGATVTQRLDRPLSR